jgi:hypothetical protein
MTTMDTPEKAKTALHEPVPAAERRAFFRLDWRHPVKFRLIQNSEDEVRLATTSNISASGILFQSRFVVPPSSVLWMDLDWRTLRICREIEDRALVFEKGLLGRVVRVEENPEDRGTYEIGVCFMRRGDRIPPEFRR